MSKTKVVKIPVGMMTLQDGCTCTKYEFTQPMENGGYLLYVDKLVECEPTVAAPCGCHPEAGIVCDTCAAMAEKNVAELADYVNDFVTKRFPSGLEGDIRRIISECVLDAFHDGARWQEAQPPGEPSLIIGVDHAAPGHDKSASRIIIAQR